MNKKRTKGYIKACRRCGGDGCTSCRTGKRSAVASQILASIEKLTEYKGK